MRKFFVGCNLCFEEELERELAEFWPYLLDLDGRPHSSPLTILETVPGGILLQAPLHVGLQINFFSKLANRVLLRIQENKVRDFPKLFQSLSDLKKDPWLRGLNFSFHVSAKESRLNHEGRILEILKKVFPSDKSQNLQALYLRMDQDVCTVSLDSTGTHLHKRTDRVEQGEAPLRETLAAFCARELIGDFSAAELQKVTLVDPMCGTGSLLREALTLYQPHLRADFSFLNWPQTPKLLKSPSLGANYPDFPLLFHKVRACDREPASIERAQASLAGFGDRAEVICQDLFQAQPFKEPGPCWVLSNPPYGERLKADFGPRQLIGQLHKIYRPQRLALLLGESQSRQLEKEPGPLTVENKWKFKNGGLPVQLWVFSGGPS